MSGHISNVVTLSFRVEYSPRVAVRNDEDGDAAVAEGEGEVPHGLLLRYADDGVVQPVPLLECNSKDI